MHTIFERTGLERKVRPIKGFVLPFEGDVVIWQGYDGPYSHFPVRRIGPNFDKVEDDTYSIDFDLPFGTEIRAARDGVVESVCDVFSMVYRGLDLREGMLCWPNLVKIRHEDGTFAIYAHLEEGSAFVEKGRYVYQGDLLARTGENGWIGPNRHLHFEVCEDSRRRLSLPVVFDDYDGSLYHSIARELE